jgi:uncharacterized protein
MHAGRRSCMGSRRRSLIAAVLLGIAAEARVDAAQSPSAAWPEPVKTQVSAQGLVADLYIPAGAVGKLPAVIVLGGSEGGMGSAAARDARLIAQHGYAVMQLAYFDAPGLPKTLESIPLEYFKTAIDWFQSQPGADSGRLGVVGTSIGGEAALVVASHYPDIKVVVAAVPSNVVWPGISTTKSSPESTWTLGGKPLPVLPYGAPGGGFQGIYGLYDNGLKGLDQHRHAIIPVERIAGPVLLVCGRHDELWPSCPMSERIMGRLKDKRFAHPYRLLAYDDAGHASFGPPLASDDPHLENLSTLGGTAAGNNAARRDAWPQSMAFLDAVLKR